MRHTTILILALIILLLAGCIIGCVSTSPPDGSTSVTRQQVNISSNGLAYPAYLAYPSAAGRYPAVVLIHSFNGLEPGYRTMVDRFAANGYVVIAPQWQTFTQQPSDDVVEGIIRSSITYLQGRSEVNASRLGLTGFCAGGRYTMLFAPQVKDLHSAVAWYGFPYNPGFANQTTPAEHIDQLDIPILIIHGSRDMASNVTDIYRYAGQLDAAGKYFELKVYQGQPHGFMITQGALSEGFVAQNAFREMVDFFDRTLI
ncbi:MAG: dienelactone hydrolase family protein [Methanomicrobiales archaeon]|nr:dienelactone hydrolase family protein [Methanomicrobiales archaeon]